MKLIYRRPTHPRPRRLRVTFFATAGSVLMTVMLALSSLNAAVDPRVLMYPDASGAVMTVTTASYIDFQNPFFKSLGTNGRACVTCHQPGDGWSITPEHIRARFEATGGLDPLFHENDGSNSPDADMSTVASRRAACSMLLTKGLIRVGIGVPEDAEFVLESCDDPYNYASAKELSLFRRPLPTTNLRFLSGVMWDGRETLRPMTIQPLNGDESVNVAALLNNLMHQANDATTGHAQAAQDLTEEEKQQIVSFEMSLYTAQSFDKDAGALTVQGANGGPAALSRQPFYIGINDNVSDPHAAFDPVAMRLFDVWAASSKPGRKAVARGQRLFNTKPILLTGVGGLNDNPYFGSPAQVVGTCTTCHNAPNVGNHSLAIPLNIGVADESRRTTDMPLYTLRNKATGETARTTDPGLALITGRWKDIGRFKGPILRGLAARAPYLHNGSAATLEDVVEFYNDRFHIGFTAQEKRDLAAFLRSL